MKAREKEYKFIYTVLLIIFLSFLAYPIVSLLAKSFQGIDGFTLHNYSEVLKNEGFVIALKNSIVVSLSAAACSLGLGFLLAYTLNFTNVWPLGNIAITWPPLRRMGNGDLWIEMGIL